MAKTKEGVIQTAVLNFLDRKYPTAEILRYNNTPTYDPKKKLFRSQHGRFMPYGVSDILFIYDGLTIGIETKTEDKYFYIERNWDKLKEGAFVDPRKKGKLTERERYHYQIAFIERLKSNRQEGFFTYSDEHCERQLRRIFGDYQIKHNYNFDVSLLD